VAHALRRRTHDTARAVVLGLAAAAAVLMVGVGLMTEAGFAGNLRYVALPAALVCVVAGVGWVWLVASARVRAGARAAAALAVLAAAVTVPFAVEAGGDFAHAMDRVRAEDALYEDLDDALAASGGAAAAN